MADLLQVLAHHANHRGLVLAGEAALMRERDSDSKQLRRELLALEQSGAIEVLSPLPFLVLRLRSWSSKASPKAIPVVKPRPSRAAPIDARGYTTTGVVGGAGEGEGAGDPLLKEILGTLGESEARSFVPVLRRYSPSLIRSALRRVAKVPPERIRSSRTALFRYLLGKLSR